MRIKSDFHDYYDCAQSYGQDQSLVYVRKKIDYPLAAELGTKRISIPLPITDRCSGYTRPGDLPTSVRFFVVGVAGKIYPVFQFIWQYAYDQKDYEAFCYSLDDIDKVIGRKCNKNAKSAFNEKVISHGRRYRNRCWSSMALRRAKFEDFFFEWNGEDQAAKVQTLFRQYPVWAIESRRSEWYVCYNCSLRSFKFFKVKDTVTTYQEIAMFLGGLATPQKPIPVPSDKDMVSIKGFDKFSFRKEPSKKKK
jgi:hypothetical protein